MKRIPDVGAEWRPGTSVIEEQIQQNIQHLDQLLARHYIEIEILKELKTSLLERSRLKRSECVASTSHGGQRETSNALSVGK